MDKIDLIYDLVKSVNEKLDKHIAQNKNNSQAQSSITMKEWGIISGIVTIICGTVVSISQIIWG